MKVEFQLLLYNVSVKASVSSQCETVVALAAISSSSKADQKLKLVNSMSHTRCDSCRYERDVLEQME